MKTPLQTFHAGLALGISFFASVSVFFQDLLGLDQWVAFISSHWLNLHWGVGLFFIVLSIVSYFHFRGRIR